MRYQIALLILLFPCIANSQIPAPDILSVTVDTNRNINGRVLIYAKYDTDVLADYKGLVAQGYAGAINFPTGHPSGQLDWKLIDNMFTITDVFTNTRVIIRNDILKNYNASIYERPGIFGAVLAYTDSLNEIHYSSWPDNNPHSTIYLEGIPASCKDHIELSWTPYIGWGNDLKQYEVYMFRNNKITLLGTTNPDVNKFSTPAPTDIDTEKYYVIRAVHTSGKHESFSNIDTVAIKLPVFPRYMEANFTQNFTTNITINFSVDSLATSNNYAVQTSNTPNGPYSIIENITDKITYIQKSYPIQKNQNIYYRLVSLNSCDQIIDSSNFINPIWLNANLNNGVVELTWNKMNDFPNGTDYYELYFNGNEIITTTTDNTYSLNIADLNNNTNTYKFSVLAYEDGINPRTNIQEISHSNIVTITAEEGFLFHEAFAPGADESIIGPKFIFQPETYTLQIFNQEGIRVANLENEAWNGILPNNRPADSGTYIYHVTYSIEGQQKLKKGYFVLLR